MNHLEYINYLKDKLLENFLSLTTKDKAMERFNHSLGVMKMAGRLALIYRPNDLEFHNKCEIAGLLHDYGKFYKVQDYLELTKVNNIDFKYDAVYNQVYHGYYGYLGVKRDLKINDNDILMAIRNHIMGAPLMSLIEEIIYVADLIEEGRNEIDIPIVKPLRKLALDGNLKEAVAFEAKHVVSHLIDRNIPIHPESLGCYNGYIKYLKKENV